MKRPLQQLIDALRRELEQHGEVLALLDEIPVVGCDPEHSKVVLAVETQTRTLLAAQRERERLQFQLAWAAEQPGACSFEELIPVLPPAYRPLLTALVEENESLRCRVGKRLRDNLCWLDRACDVSSRTLGVISFPNHHHTHTRTGSTDRQDLPLLFNA